VGLSRHVARHLALDGQHVLELGCGLGLVGVVAALQGARVLCTDYEADALAFARHNARHNHCKQVRFRQVDWRAPALRRRYDENLFGQWRYSPFNNQGQEFFAWLERKAAALY
jgi:methylase of polypeptide subunit release factors